MKDKNNKKKKPSCDNLDSSPECGNDASKSPSPHTLNKISKQRFGAFMFDDGGHLLYEKINKREKTANKVEFFDEKERQQIYSWSRRREKRLTSFWVSIKTYLLTTKLFVTFLKGFSIMTIISMVFAGDYQRREQAFLYLAEFKSKITSFCLCCREYSVALDVPKSTFDKVLNKIKQHLIHVMEYTSTCNEIKRKIIARIIYEDFSDLNQLTMLWTTHNPTKPGAQLFTMRLNNVHENLIFAFEKLRVIRDYRTPQSIRAFTKFMTLLLPIILAPLNVYFGHSVPSTSSWSPYFLTAVVAFIFGALQSVQDRLYDPFVGVFQDAIHIDDLVIWASESILHTAGRVFKDSTINIGMTEIEQNDHKSETTIQNNQQNDISIKIETLDLLKDKPSDELIVPKYSYKAKSMNYLGSTVKAPPRNDQLSPGPCISKLYTFTVFNNILSETRIISSPEASFPDINESLGDNLNNQK